VTRNKYSLFRQRERDGATRHRRDNENEAGFSLVEVIVASTILMIVLVSFSNLLVDSLTVSLNSGERQTAASLASDTIENAKALGVTKLGTAAAAQLSTPSLLTVCLATAGSEIASPQNGTAFAQCQTTTVDRILYTVTPVVSAPTGSVATVTVTVTWPTANTYVTSSQINGTG
jgi:Tfp pilus assembly protein PilV